MEYTELGSTGMEVSVIGLGAGGYSRLGLERGKTEREAQKLVERALDLGINLVDTAEKYGTEGIVGRAIDGADRDDIVISTKFAVYDDDELRSPEEMAESLDGSLDRLGTDYIDVYHLHGVRPADYDYAAETLRPCMERLKEEGKIRATGITELLSADPAHEMLGRAAETDIWDAVMAGFNLLNHSARRRVLEPAASKGTGTIGMVAVRRALSDPDVLAETIDDLVSAGELDPGEIDPRNPFDFLIHEEGATDRIDAAYRFCRHESTIDTVLTGTSSREHLESNVESALKPPLPAEDLATLADRFGQVDSVIGN